MKRQYELAARNRAAHSELDVIPFDPPKEGRVLSNYLVEYELQAKSGLPYMGRFAVYIYESAGKWLYFVKEPYLEPRLSSAVSSAVATLSSWLAPSSVVELDPIGYLVAEMERAGLMANIGVEELKAATHYLARDILGYWILDPLLRDPEIEDVSCDGVGRPVKVWHRRLNATGWLETNVSFPDRDVMDSVVSRLVHRSGRSISAYSPIVDSVLPEGFRLAATWGQEVTSLGSSFSIRKQRAEPFTLSELIKSGSFSAQLAAHLWMMLDLKGFVVISGVTASGKTTLLNSFATVLNPAWKIVSIEDTREIRLPHTGWKPLHTRTIQGGLSITLFDLVKLSLRERPDFVILGEARGQEVQALFQSAAAGTGCITTFHSPNAESMAARLTQPPLSVSPSLLELIDAAVFMVRDPETGRRRVSQVVEMTSKGPEVLFSRSDEGQEGNAAESRKLGERATAYGFSPRKLSAELQRRTDFLTSAVGRGVATYASLARELRLFYGSSSLTL
ncbi:MAG: type II/IV secretion system ATPase subunit [Nitrososphaerales archaeon]|nr:type II/IV secretion system ATPase subunit [Nitrososphaerales archaeon]